MIRKLGVLTLLTTLATISCAWPDEVHYAPEERLDRIDATLISTAKTSIDLASYALTDRIVIEALDSAAGRGVKIRIVLDPRERHDFIRLGDLADTVLSCPRFLWTAICPRGDRGDEGHETRNRTR